MYVWRVFALSNGHCTVFCKSSCSLAWILLLMLWCAWIRTRLSFALVISNRPSGGYSHHHRREGQEQASTESHSTSPRRCVCACQWSWVQIPSEAAQCFFSLSVFGLYLTLSCLPLHIHVQDLIMYMYVHSMPIANAPKSLQTECILIHMLTIVTGQAMKWITILKGLVHTQYIRC